MESLETELERARDVSVPGLADAIESIGFECTRCGACCKAEASAGCGGSADGSGSEPHTATVFPDEIRRLQAAATERGDEPYDWRDVARPMPYGVEETDEGQTGETFEWALQTDSCGDCAFYTEGDGGTGACTVHDDRPLVCRTYPFSLALGGATEPMGEAVDREGLVRAHECEGLGREIEREAAEELAETLKRRTIRELEEAIGVRDNYRSTEENGVIVHDSEGQKRPDGTRLSDGPDR